MPTSCVIFDVDGTLVDSGGFDDTLYTAAVREVLGNVRIRSDWAAYEHVTDAGLVLEICRENGLEVRDAGEQVRARFGELISTYLRAVRPCTPIKGALPFWEKLRDDKDVEVGIATGGWGHTARMKLESSGFAYSDVPLASSDDGHIRTEIMERCRGLMSQSESTTYIGDGEWDLAATERLGWRFVGVGDRLRGKCSDWIPDFSSIDLLYRLVR
jgi:FMN phosphatase YigB (HAD superfamily)